MIPIPLISFALEGGGKPHKAVAESVINELANLSMYLSMCLQGSSSFVPQNLEKLEDISNATKSRGTRMGSPLGLTNGSIGSTGGGSGLGGGVAMVVFSNSTLLLYSVFLSSSLLSWGELLASPCWVF